MILVIWGDPTKRGHLQVDRETFTELPEAEEFVDSVRQDGLDDRPAYLVEVREVNECGTWRKRDE